MNANEAQWLEGDDWIYESIFEIPAYQAASLNQHDVVELVFEGLDTHTDIYLNN